MKPRFLLTTALLGILLMSPLSGYAVSTELSETETKTQKDERMGWWREARFGMFVHWGLYSVLAGEYEGKPVGGAGEWIMRWKNIPISTYAAYAPQFNPVKYNADAWVKAAKDAGVKYIVITAKHHEGFAMFHTAVDNYNIYDATPFKRDPLRELADACHRQGMKLGFYYSQNLDWHHPGGGGYGPEWDPAHKGDPDLYVRNVVIPQVRELLSNYGGIDVIWWDIPGGVITRKRADLVYKTVMDCNPKIVMNNRLGGGYRGDTETPEQSIPARGFPGRDWETCMTMNGTWGYKKNDTNFKSSTTLLRNLVDIASKGGNYLLNVGPTPEGEIPQPELDRLHEMGQWLKVNGESIYGTQATPFARSFRWGRCTQKPGTLYLHVFNWPQDGKLIIPIQNKVRSARLLASPDTSLTAAAPREDGIELALPSSAPSPVDSVIALNYDGPLELLSSDAAVAQEANGSINLHAADATLLTNGSGKCQAGLEGPDGHENIGFWTRANDYAQWPVKVNKPGDYRVTINYSSEADYAGSTLVVAAGEQSVSKVLESTGSWANYRDQDLGTIHIAQPGNITVIAKAGTMKRALCDLRSVTLNPVR